jgi:hypothetical protein
MFWCTPAHALCLDIVPKLSARLRGHVIHVHPWLSEMAAMGAPEADDEDAVCWLPHKFVRLDRAMTSTASPR